MVFSLYKALGEHQTTCKKNLSENKDCTKQYPGEQQ